MDNASTEKENGVYFNQFIKVSEWNSKPIFTRPGNNEHLTV